MSDNAHTLATHAIHIMLDALALGSFIAVLLIVAGVVTGSI